MLAVVLTNGGLATLAIIGLFFRNGSQAELERTGPGWLLGCWVSATRRGVLGTVGF